MSDGMEKWRRYQGVLASLGLGNMADPFPLAVLPAWPRKIGRGRESHEPLKAARAWALSHPDQRGFIVSPHRDDAGWRFYEVSNGQARASSAYRHVAVNPQ